MVTLRQSAQVSLPAADVLRLLGHAPMLLAVGVDPCVHYVAPEGWQPGSPVNFHFVHGLWRISWAATVARHEQGCIHTLLSGGPFGSWSSLLEVEALTAHSCVVRDLWEWELASAELEELLPQCQIRHAFEQRRAAERLKSASPTTQFRALDSSSSAMA